MPVEFRLEPTGVSGDTLFKQTMSYDGSGRRISKTSLRKNVNSDDWTLEQITHYTGIGSEIRKEYHNGELQSTKVVVNMPQGLGRYGIENADGMAKGDEFYLKNHLGSTMMVAQVSSTNASEPAKVAAAYDYRAFGEQVTLKKSADKVTENFTGKELDDEIELNYFGARYLDPMLGMWTSVDPARQFASPYLYAGNGANPVNVIDPDGNAAEVAYYRSDNSVFITIPIRFDCGGTACSAGFVENRARDIEKNLTGSFDGYNVVTSVVDELEDVPTNVFHYVSENFLLDKFGGAQSRFDMNTNEGWINQNSLTPAFSTPHEAGHAVGLEDKYLGKGAPNPLYPHNLMSVPDPMRKNEPLNLKRDQIQEIFTSPNNVYFEYE